LSTISNRPPPGIVLLKVGPILNLEQKHDSSRLAQKGVIKMRPSLRPLLPGDRMGHQTRKRLSDQNCSRSEILFPDSPAVINKAIWDGKQRSMVQIYSSFVISHATARRHLRCPAALGELAISECRLSSA
jgi:hypothetical protein